MNVFFRPVTGLSGADSPCVGVAGGEGVGLAEGLGPKISGSRDLDVVDGGLGTEDSGGKMLENAFHCWEGVSSCDGGVESARCRRLIPMPMLGWVKKLGRDGGCRPGWDGAVGKPVPEKSRPGIVVGGGVGDSRAKGSRRGSRGVSHLLVRCRVGSGGGEGVVVGLGTDGLIDATEAFFSLRLGLVLSVRRFAWRRKVFRPPPGVVAAA